jgi:hypothetical protein
VLAPLGQGGGAGERQRLQLIAPALKDRVVFVESRDARAVKRALSDGRAELPEPPQWFREVRMTLP